MNQISKLLRLLCSCIALANLPGCSLFNTQDTPPPGTANTFDWPNLSSELDKFDSWTMIGKIGVRTPDQSMSAAINQWVQTRELFDIQLSSTFFGLGNSRLIGNPVFITLLEAGEDPVSSDQPEDLLNKALNKTAVKEYIEVNKEPPPGVKYDSYRDLQWRRGKG